GWVWCGGPAPPRPRRASRTAGPPLLLPSPPPWHRRSPDSVPSCRRSQRGAAPTRCPALHPRRIGLWIDRAISLWIQGFGLHNPWGRTTLIVPVGCDSYGGARRSAGRGGARRAGAAARLGEAVP